MYKTETQGANKSMENGVFSPSTIIGSDRKKIERTKDGNWSDNTSADMKEVLNAMLLTPTGTKMYEELRDSPTQVTIKIDRETEGTGIYGVTYPTGKIKVGKVLHNRKAEIIIYAKRILEENSRFGSLLEGLNAVGTHEALHAVNTDQRKKDKAKPNAWETERLTLDYEYQSRKEFREKLLMGEISLAPDDWSLSSPHIGDESGPPTTSNLEGQYEIPNDSKDPYNTKKPGFYGIDKQGKSKTHRDNFGCCEYHGSIPKLKQLKPPVKSKPVLPTKKSDHDKFFDSIH